MAAFSLFVVAEGFVVDVAGDNPSIPKLAEMLARVHEWQRADERNSDAGAALRKLNIGGFSHRCEVSQYDLAGPIPLSIQVAYGDTWQEVLEKMRGVANTPRVTATTSV